MIELYTYTYVYILKRDDLLEFLTSSGLLVEQWLFPDGKAKHLVVVGPRRLMSLLSRSGAGVPGNPREQLLFSLPWHHEVGSDTREGMPQQQGVNSPGVRASRPSLSFLWAATRSVVQIWGGSFSLNGLIKKIPHRCS